MLVTLSLFIELLWGSKVTTLSEISWSQLSYGLKKKKKKKKPYKNFLYLDSVFYGCPQLLMTIFPPYTHLRFEGYTERGLSVGSLSVFCHVGFTHPSIKLTMVLWCLSWDRTWQLSPQRVGTRTLTERDEERPGKARESG